MADKFDPTDLKYQADKKFAPDKESQWNHPAEHDGWVHAHNAIRGELRMIQEIFESLQKQAIPEDPLSTKLKDWQVKALQSIFQAHSQFIHHHHRNEDEIMTPELIKRIVYPEKLTSDHDGLVEAMASLQKAFDNLKVGDSINGTMGALLSQWVSYSEDLKEHLLEEEEIGLPLVRAYFTPKEIKAIVQKIVKKETKMELGCFVYHMGEARMRIEFMKENGIPFFVWYIVFSGALKSYQKNIIELVTALKLGAEPIPQRKGLLGC